MTPITGFSPAANAGPGSLSHCEAMHPYAAGMESAPAFVVKAQGVGSRPFGAASGRLLDGTQYTYMSTGALWRLTADGWALAGSVVGPGYYPPPTSTTFAQFGNAVLASSLLGMGRSLSGADFAPLAGAPKAKIVVAQQGFALAFDFHHAQTGALPNGWMCSAYLDETDWSRDANVYSVSGVLIEGSGPITAALPLGQYVVAYKANRAFLGRYDPGSPHVWAWAPIGSQTIGAQGVHALCETEGRHVFLGAEDFYETDGASIVALPSAGVRKWFFERCSDKSAVVMRYSAADRRVYIHYPTGEVNLSACLSYHIDTKAWGHESITAAMAVQALSSGAMLSELPGFIDDYPAPINAYGKAGDVQALIGPTGALMAPSHDHRPSAMRFWDVGDVQQSTMLLSVILDYEAAPRSSVCKSYAGDFSGAGLSYSKTSKGFDGRHDVRDDARYHAAEIEFEGGVKVKAVHIDTVPTGNRVAVDSNALATLVGKRRDDQWVVNVGGIRVGL